MDDSELEARIEAIAHAMNGNDRAAALELAAQSAAVLRTGHVEDLLAHAVRCIGIRRELGDVTGVLEAARTACELLHQLECDDLTMPFLPIILGEARLLGRTEYAAYGYVTLVRHILATEDPVCIDVLLDSRDWLARCDDEHAQVALEFARTSPVVLARVASRVTVRMRAVAPPMFGELGEVGELGEPS